MEEYQIGIIQGFIDFGSLLSILGSSAILISILSTVGYFGKGKIWNRIIFFMSLCDMCGSIDLAIRRAFLNESEGNEGCKIQGLTIQFFFISSILWTTAIAVTIFIVIILDKEIDVVERYEYVIHIIIWSISLILTVPLYFLDNSKKYEDSVMGNATFWCWITDKHSDLRMIFFFGPVWIIFFFNAFVYISMKIIIRKKNKDISEAYAKYSIAKRSNLYLLVLFITWIWGTINRIQNLLYSGHPQFILYLLHATFTPLQGFLNSIVYFWYAVIKHFVMVKREIQEQEDNRRRNRPRHNSNARLEEGRPIKLVRKRSDRDLFDNYYVYKPKPSSRHSHSKDKKKWNNNNLNEMNMDETNNKNKNKGRTLERQKTNVTQYSYNSTSQMLKNAEN